MDGPTTAAPRTRIDGVHQDPSIHRTGRLAQAARADPATLAESDAHDDPEAVSRGRHDWPSDAAIVEIRRFADAMNLVANDPIMTHHHYVSDGRAIVRTPVDLGCWRCPTESDHWMYDPSDRMNQYIVPKRTDRRLTDQGVVIVTFDFPDERGDMRPKRGRCFVFPDGSGLVVPDEQIKRLTPICGAPTSWMARRASSTRRPIVVAGMIGRNTVLALSPYAHRLADDRGLCSREMIDILTTGQAAPSSR